MIEIKKSETADTRTCDWSKVTKEALKVASVQHISDIAKGLVYFQKQLESAARMHDFDKLSDIDGFHADFSTGFERTTWWDNHRKVNRHHLTADDGIPDDVCLIDVLEFIVDCVMAGKARSGEVRPLEIDPKVLMNAFENTWKELASMVAVVEE